MYLIVKGSVMGYPKNTIDGVLLSKFDKNIDSVLIDVRMTNDNNLVLYENDLIFNNNYISEMDYPDIRKIRLGSGIRHYHIPLLDEILKFYEKDLLVIYLHHNYNQNEKLVKKLKDTLKKYYIKKVVIMVDNTNLEEYLHLLTDYEIYNIRDNENIIDVDVYTENYNNRLTTKFIYNTGKNLNEFIRLNQNGKEKSFILTNSPSTLRKEYLLIF